MDDDIESLESFSSMSSSGSSQGSGSELGAFEEVVLNLPLQDIDRVCMHCETRLPADVTLDEHYRGCEAYRAWDQAQRLAAAQRNLGRSCDYCHQPLPREVSQPAHYLVCPHHHFWHPADVREAAEWARMHWFDQAVQMQPGGPPLPDEEARFDQPGPARPLLGRDIRERHILDPLAPDQPLLAQPAAAEAIHEQVVPAGDTLAQALHEQVVLEQLALQRHDRNEPVPAAPAEHIEREVTEHLAPGRCRYYHTELPVGIPFEAHFQECTNHDWRADHIRLAEAYATNEFEARLRRLREGADYNRLNEQDEPHRRDGRSCAYCMVALTSSETFHRHHWRDCSGSDLWPPSILEFVTQQRLREEVDRFIDGLASSQASENSDRLRESISRITSTVIDEDIPNDPRISELLGTLRAILERARQALQDENVRQVLLQSVHAAYTVYRASTNDRFYPQNAYEDLVDLLGRAFRNAAGQHNPQRDAQAGRERENAEQGEAGPGLEAFFLFLRVVCAASTHGASNMNTPIEALLHLFRRAARNASGQREPRHQADNDRQESSSSHEGTSTGGETGDRWLPEDWIFIMPQVLAWTPFLVRGAQSLQTGMFRDWRF